MNVPDPGEVQRRLDNAPYGGRAAEANRIRAEVGFPSTTLASKPRASRKTLLTITWADDLPDDEALRLSRAWAAKISEKPVVTDVRLQLPAPPPAPPPKRHRYRLTRRVTGPVTGNFVYYRVGVRSQVDRWCYGCGATIAALEPHATSDNTGHVCMACIEVAIPESAPS